MAGSESDEETGRSYLLAPQMISWFFLFRLILLARTHWRGILDYQAHSGHPSLPLSVQDSQHMIMTSLIVLASWSVPSCLAKCSLRKTVWWVTGVVDLVVAGFLIAALVKRAQQFPTTVPQCAHGLGSEPVGKLFAYLALVANKTKENDDPISTPGSVCHDYLGEWVYVIMISYTWTSTSIIGVLGLSGERTAIVLMLVFFPLVLALGLGCGISYLGYLAFFQLVEFGAWLYQYISPPIKWLYRYVSPPVKWSIRHLSWPLMITWFALKGIAPSFRYMYRARLKWVLMKESSVSASLDPERGRFASSSGSIPSLAEPIETPPTNLSNRSLALMNSPTRQPKGAESTIESLFSNAPPAAAPICGHANDWHCQTCGTQACFRCSVEISKTPPPTTQHFFCEPRCSRCYLNTMCCGVLPAKKKQNPCSHRQDRCDVLPTPRVCRPCSENRSRDAILRRLEEQERQELRHLARHNLKCGVCETRLRPKGPRWWTCCDCNEECKSDLHPPWSKVPE